MKIKEYIKQSKLWFILATYIFFLALFIFKSDFILDYFSRFYALLEPVFLGLAIAFILNIPMVKLESALTKYVKLKFIQKNKRSFAILLSVAMMFVVLIVLAMMILPELIKSVGNLIGNITILVNNVINNSDKLLSFLNINFNSIESKQIEQIISDFGLNYNDLLNQSTKWVSSISINIFSLLSGGAAFITELMFGFMISLYFLSSKEDLIRQLKMLIAGLFSTETTIEIFHFAKKTNAIFKNFVGGQLVECFIIGFMMYIPLALFKFPFALLIASITTVCAIIPIFGAMISWIIGFILILSIDPYRAIAFLFLYQFIQQIENNLVYPRVVGESVGLPALWTLLSITIFGGLFGLPGLLLAVPVAASLYSFLTEKIYKKLTTKHITVEKDKIIIENKQY